jgi:hypothetical protein
VDPFARAVPTINVALLCVAEVMAFALLAKPPPDTGDTPPNVKLPFACPRADSWLEYIAFVITAQASAIAFATVVWLLLSRRNQPSDDVDA